MTVIDMHSDEHALEEIVLSGDKVLSPDEDATGTQGATRDDVHAPVSESESVEAGEVSAEEDGGAPDLASGFVAELLEPVSEEMPVGSDPHYGDRFYEIKREIDKLADNDYARVISAARAILKEEGKDLRVAAYHLMGSVYVDGVQGLIDGLEVYKGLLDTYGRYCFPTRDNMRLSAVRWLSNRKMQVYCEEKLAAASPDQIRHISAQIVSINSLLETQFGDTVEPWTSLDEPLSRFMEKARSAQPAPRAVAATSPDTTEVGTGTAHASEGSEGGRGHEPGAENVADSPPGLSTEPLQPVSEQQLLRHARELIRYLSDAKDYSRAAGMARALLWGNLQLPPASGNNTNVTGPRSADLVEIRQLLSDEEYVGAFTLIEALLFGPGGRLCLDLQYYATQAARGMKQRDLVHSIENATLGLVQRLPRLVDLQFEDGTPFAQAETRRWLEDLALESGEGTTTQAMDDETVNKIAAQAAKAAAKGNLASGLVVFAEASTAHPLTAFRLQMEMANFCLTHQRADLAVPAFQKLMDKARAEHLASWSPDLLGTLAKNYRDALQAMQEQVDGEDKVAYQHQINKLSDEICQADLVQASRFL